MVKNRSVLCGPSGDVGSGKQNPPGCEIPRANLYDSGARSDVLRMVSFVSEFLAMYDMGLVTVIDGCAYAPVEQLAYSVIRAWTFHLVSIALVSFLVFVLSCIGFRCFKRFVLKK